MKNHSLYLRNQERILLAKVPITINKLFLIDIQNDNAKCLKVCLKDNSWIWHLRLGHLNFDSLKIMSTKRMVKELPPINHSNQFCEGCLLEKHFRRPFPKEATTKAKEPLQLIHANLCGLITPSSYGKNNYFLLFIDDFSRKTWAYFLKEKSEGFGVFKKFRPLLKKKVVTK